MANASDKASLSEVTGPIDSSAAGPRKSTFDTDSRSNEASTGGWLTSKWELWTFYVYYIVSILFVQRLSQANHSF